MAVVKNFCVDRFEASLEGRQPDGHFAPHPPYARPLRGVVYRAVSRKGRPPQAYLSQIQAADACERAGKRLCSLDEWYTACRGSSGTTYPYGPRKIAGKCNTNKPHLLSILFGTDARAWKYEEHFNSPLLNQQPGFLADSGDYEGCHSDFGTYDMVGNLHEWVSDSVTRALPHKLPLRPGIRKAVYRNLGHGIFMGGFFSTGSQHGSGCGFITVGHEKAYHDYSTGFRCCKDQLSSDSAAP